MKVKPKKGASDAMLLDDIEYMVYMVVIDTNQSDHAVRYLIDTKWSFGYLYNASLFDITDVRTPLEWMFKMINSYELNIGFEDMLYSDFLSNLIDGETKEKEISRRHIQEQKRWYYEDEVEKFFVEHPKFSEEQKQAMIEYYKAQPNPEQWNKDQEMLSFL